MDERMRKTKDKTLNRQKGFTLVELIIAIVMVGIIVLTLTGFLSNGLTYHTYNSREFTVQTDVKFVATHVAQQIKNATVTFIVTADDYSGKVTDLTAGWNYIGQNESGTQLVEYTYNQSSGKHEKRVLTQGAFGMKYDIVFDKDNDTDDKLIDFDVTGWLDQSVTASKNDHRYALQSTVSADKSNMVFSRATPAKPGIALAYRSDPIPKGLQINITMVLDNSGSMVWDMKGSTTNKENLRRITILKTETKRLVNDFAAIGFVNIVLSPFGSIARDTSPQLYDIISDRQKIDHAIDNMKAEGGTNVGDGMRAGFHKMFSSGGRDPLLEQRDYAIILTDGAANAYIFKYPTGPGTPSVDWRGGYDTPRSNIDNALHYISLVYDRFRNDLDKVFVIGFSANSNERALGSDIGRRTGGTGNPASNYYDATSSAELRAIYDTIRNEITRELWYVMGP